jgi:hypothetical protein
VLAEIKAAARDGVRVLDPDAEAVVKRVVSWCIRGYYGVPPDQQVRREGELPSPRAD